ncbi:5-formyltetrahydrofolate cyclo-ligase [Rhodovastum atsumiense]|uniref:5-formyltetrahydrofolate cyclo-ligase n=1 Tax=Rhodovastum atsumiense TaxID=504468 RepID=A0A5M6IMF3_9PROT|nr:5-formyltetrahydrofolate cyclo-ligase [Rhodovastum atsumiense]KAA5609029.1 5-formyltetrahydrofolate cyclo-ligase [Rhodovastum atsumiense]CAH2604667.1 5-formyltetrahydrofolate cyclo-ligase [Rhodovastum atsumiense]
MAAPHSSFPDLAAAKRDLRRRMHAVRAGADPAAGTALSAHVLQAMPPGPGAVVSGFWPMGPEIDIRPLLEALHARGHAVALPETPPRGNPLIFRLWHPGMALLPERFGTARPTGAVVRPDWLLVPLLAFDRTGRRLGYGGGYYDRTLAGLPGAIAIGCAYACQEVDVVPADDYDARLHAIATERGVIPCSGD